MLFLCQALCVPYTPNFSLIFNIPFWSIKNVSYTYFMYFVVLSYHLTHFKSLLFMYGISEFSTHVLRRSVGYICARQAFLRTGWSRHVMVALLPSPRWKISPPGLPAPGQPIRCTGHRPVGSRLAHSGWLEERGRREADGRHIGPAQAGEEGWSCQ